MVELGRLLVGIPRKWYLLALVIAVAALNPLFLSLDEGAFEQTAPTKYRLIDGKLIKDVSAEVGHIREKGVWITATKAPDAAESSTDKEERDEATINANPEWRLVGIVTTVSGKKAVLQLADGDVRSVTEGDQMPSGEQIVALGEDYLTITVNGVDKRLVLYPELL